MNKTNFKFDIVHKENYLGFTISVNIKLFQQIETAYGSNWKQVAEYDFERDEFYKWRDQVRSNVIDYMFAETSKVEDYTFDAANLEEAKKIYFLPY